LQEADFYKNAAGKAAQYIEENRGATEKILFSMDNGLLIDNG
jgi:hypothetical protein